MVLGGAFQMADTHGLPLTNTMDEAEKRSCVVSIPHYFASAMEHGWDDIQTFGKIREALSDTGRAQDMDRIKLGCMAMFMDVAHAMPGKNAMEIGQAMREKIESDKLAHVWKEAHG
jgi:alanyl-tRNA synthetase